MVKLFLRIVPVKCIGNTENVQRVHCFLDSAHHLLLHFDVHETVLHEPLSQLADSVVMRDGTAILHYNLSRPVFYVLVHIANFIQWELVILQREVDIDCCSSFIELCYSEADEDIFASQAMNSTCIENSLSNVLAERSNLRPRA